MVDSDLRQHEKWRIEAEQLLSELEDDEVAIT